MSEEQKKIHLQIVTPYKLMVDKRVDEVRLPATEGEIGVLYGHSPLITSLQAGAVGYKLGKGEEDILCVSWGFAEILNDKVTILVETAEIANEIDIERARKAKDLAEKKLKGDIGTGHEYVDTNMSIKKHLARINVGNRGPK